MRIDADTLSDYIGNQHCNGCMLCMQVCPNNAITETIGELGFTYPIIDEKKCCHCGKCIQNCPNYSITNKKISNSTCYAIQALDKVRYISSSGGMFYSIACSFIERGGYVCGVLLKGKVAKHVIVNKVKDLKELCKSKYIQSDISGVYKDILSLINHKKIVLFVGTPCQCNAMKKYCNDDNNLYTIDLLCMGVPSQKLFEKYIDENINGDIEEIDFRYKKDNLWSQNLVLSLGLQNKDRLTIGSNDSSYYQAFLTGISLRKSCTECIFAGNERCGDVTLGDFWGIESYAPECDDGYGTSLVLCNSSKGEKLLFNCNVYIKKMKELPSDIAFKCNPILMYPIGESYSRNRMVSLYEKDKEINKIVDEVLEEKADCGIFNYWCCDDNGAILTAYALQRSLEKIGYTSLLINTGFERKGNGISKRFEAKYLKTTLPVTKEKLNLLNRRFKSFIVGSDQVFRREWVPDSFFLGFVDNNKQKISVSASFGKNDINCDKSQERELKYWLKRFDSLSVREDTGVEILKRMGVRGKQIIDPVFWLDGDEYKENFNIFASKNIENNLVVYFRDYNEKKRHIVEEIGKKLGYDVVFLNDETEVEKFVECISGAKLVITDSYHGVCFSVIFNVEFICIYNELRGNARFDSLISCLKLDKKHFITEAIEIDNIIINITSDWNEVNEKIEEERKKAIKWMKSALCRKRISSSILPEIERTKVVMMDHINNYLNYIYRRCVKRTYEDKVICYGAGFYGRQAVKKYGDKIAFFIDKNPSIKWCEGKYVYTIGQANKMLNKNARIVITVDQRKCPEIRTLLFEYGYKNVIEMEEAVR